MAKKTSGVLVAALATMLSVGAAEAAQCGSTGAGFDAWKRAFAAEAKAEGIGAAGISALMRANYSTGTIRADRGQKSFKLSLPAFMAKRGAAAIAARGKSMKRANAALFASIEQRYGVPPGPLLAIWGMETGFGGIMGNQNTLSAVATLAYDCRRPAYFTDQLYAALKLVDRGAISASHHRARCMARSARPSSCPRTSCSTASTATAMAASTSSAQGRCAGLDRQFPQGPWLGRRGPATSRASRISPPSRAGTRPSVYQQAIAIIGKQIDGG